MLLCFPGWSVCEGSSGADSLGEVTTVNHFCTQLNHFMLESNRASQVVTQGPLRYFLPRPVVGGVPGSPDS
jgi:hypothetical protein